MEFKLDGEEKTTSSAPKQTSYPIDEVSKENKYYYHAPQPTPVVTPPPQKKSVGIPKIVFFIPIIVIVAVVLTLIPWNKKTSLDDLATVPQAEIESTLGIKLSDNPQYLTKLSVANGNRDGIRVETTPQADFGVIYYNQIQYGICFDNSKYSLFGFKIGDPEYKIFSEENTDAHHVTIGEGTGYKFTKWFVNVDDMNGGQSTANYLIGEDGSLLVLVVNNTSKRVVNIVYYYDYERNIEGMDFF